MEAGLAATATQPQGGPDMVQQVVQMLLQGADPEELLRQGVPEEVLRQAIEIVLAQTGNGQQAATAAPPVTDGGLAATSVGQ